MIMKTAAVAGLVCAILLSMAGEHPAWAPDARAKLGGRVVDAQGGVVSGAEVVVTSEDTSVKQKTTTNIQGNWLVQFLNPGPYSFTVTPAGVKQAERHGSTLQPSANKHLYFQLEPH